ncbi:response regulator transcription factor [Flavobacterium sp. Fl-318]|uniref:Response regulator transcription factor n=1 Tax=Flavobacterium cupriresistens TaxID=2893885 RepID=A0ABU4RHD0_9FLAO|nr:MULTISPECIES: response regulator transcription factor [unclassified Flavobacterium]MDX6191681.1 response regulator transcription factor [Flavobacterium sp. Fl-318]UFH41625.1 response regulator transcription factor [Flavobacterium sp. F-323]
MVHIAFFEDHPIVCDGLNSFFSNQKGLEVHFYAKDKEELYAKILENNILDLIIVDLIANDVQGLEVYEYLAKHHPSLKVIAFTSLSSPILVENLLNIGVKGYVNKNQDPEALLEAIQLVSDGGVYLPEDYSFLSKQNRPNTTMTLTAKELIIMQLIIREFTTADIAKELKLSVNTIENHRKNIFNKLDVSNVAGMVREASKLGHIN